VAGACATPGSALLPEMPSWEARNRVLGGLQRWQFDGRIAVRTGPDGFNGKLRWAQQRDNFEATVSGPLGVGTVRIEGDQRRVVLTDKDGVRTELGDAERELRYRYGWTIPVASLRYWALGIPDPGSAAEARFNADGQLERILQQGWSVDITRYGDGGGQLMPMRLSVQNADTRVRLVIDHWIF
jgi:outer membrane lipoprotein LolB